MMTIKRMLAASFITLTFFLTLAVNCGPGAAAADVRQKSVNIVASPDELVFISSSYDKIPDRQYFYLTNNGSTDVTLASDLSVENYSITKATDWTGIPAGAARGIYVRPVSLSGAEESDYAKTLNVAMTNGESVAVKLSFKVRSAETILIKSASDIPKSLVDGDKLILDADPIEPSDAISINIPTGATVTLDLKGQTLKRAGDVLLVNGHGKLIILDSSDGKTGKIENTDTSIFNTSAVCLNESVGLRLDSGTITARGDTSLKASNNAIKVNWDSNLSGVINIYGGTVEATDSSDAIAYNGNGSLTLHNGTVKSAYGNAINLGYDKNGDLTIKGGTVEAAKSSGCAIKHAGKGKIEISGGTVTSPTAQENSATILITNAASGKGKTALEIKDGAAVTNTSTGTEGQPGAIYNVSEGNVIISGGKVSSVRNNTINVKKEPSSQNNPGDLIISGGEISNTEDESLNVHKAIDAELCNVTISGNAVISCVGGDKNSGAVYLNNATLNLNGGTVRHTSGEADRYAVYAYKNSEVHIGANGAILRSNNAAINIQPKTVAGNVTILASANFDGGGKAKVETSALPGDFKYLQFADTANFTALADDSSDTKLTSKLTLTFDKDVAGLTADDLTVTGATKGTLTKTAGKTGEYDLAVYPTQSPVSVKAAKEGVCFTPDNRSVPVIYEQVATPQISPAAGVIPDGQQVTISCLTQGASIYYTLDGTFPTKLSTPYTAPFPVNAPVSVAAIAVKDGMMNSAVLINNYVKAVNYTSLTANGSATETTTKLTFTFDADIANLTANDITLTGAAAGTLEKRSGETGAYDLPVAGITVDGSEIKASVAKSGYIITPSEQKTTARVYNATVAPAALIYNKQFTSQKASFTLTRGSYTQTGVSLNGAPLVKDTDYTIDAVNGVCNITSECLSGLNAGEEYDFTFNMSGGVDPIAKISIIDAAPSLAVALTPDDIHLIGEEITLTATSANMPGAAFNWYVNDANSYDNAVPISGAASTTYVFTPTAAETKYYFCKANGVFNSNIVEAIVVAPQVPYFSASPNDTTVVAGQTAKFTAEASGVPSPAYQWQVKSVSASDWADVTDGEGGKTLSYTTGVTTEAMSGYSYRCVASSRLGTTHSAIAKLTVAAQTYDISVDKPSLDFGEKTEGYATVPAAQTVTVKNDGNWDVHPSAFAVNGYYDIVVPDGWTDALAPGGTRSFTIRPKAALEAGDRSSDIAVNTAEQSSATVTSAFKVNPALTVKIDGVTAIISGDSTTLTANAQGGTGAYTYRWTGGGISEQTQSVTVSPTETATYTVDVADEGDGAAQTSATVTVTPQDHTITLDKTALDFGGAYEGYQTRPAAQTVTVENKGNLPVHPADFAENDFFETAAESDWQTALAPGETRSFTLQPKLGLAPRAYDETIAVTTRENSRAEIKAKFAVVALASAYVTPTQASYDKSEAPSGLDFTLFPGSYALLYLANGDKTLALGADYTVNGGVYTVTREYLSAQPTGVITLTFVMSGGPSPTATITITENAPVDASVTPTSAKFDKNGTSESLDFTLDSGSYEFIALMNADTALEPGKDFARNGGVFSVSAEYLAARPLGTLTFTFDMTGGLDPTATVEISDSSLVDARVTPTSAQYDRRSSSGLKFALDPGSYALTAITNGETELESGVDYVSDGDEYLITKKYLDELPVGIYILTFDMDGGSDPTVEISIPDDSLLLDELTLGKGKTVLAGNLLLIKSQRGVKWTSDNTNVLKIKGKGRNSVLNPKEKGEANLTAAFPDGKTRTIRVTVVEKANAAIKLKMRNKLTLQEGQSERLSPKVKPDTASDKSLKWFTSNPAVATVERNGTITAVAKGECKVFALTTAGARQSVTVTVKKRR